MMVTIVGAELAAGVRSSVRGIVKSGRLTVGHKQRQRSERGQCSDQRASTSTEDNLTGRQGGRTQVGGGGKERKGRCGKWVGGGEKDKMRGLEKTVTACAASEEEGYRPQVL